MHAEGIHSLEIAQLLLSLVSCVRGEFTQVVALDPRRNCARKKEAWRVEEKFCEKPLTIYEKQRDCTKSWIASELRLCVIQTYFHLYDNTKMGF